MRIDEPQEGIIISARRPPCSHQQMPIGSYSAGTIGWCPGCGHYVVWRQWGRGWEWKRLTLLDLDLWFRVFKARGKI